MPGLDSNTKLLLHANGQDYLKSAFAKYNLDDNLATTAVIDSGSGANNGTASGNTTAQATDGKVGGKFAQSGVFAGASYISVPDHADWYFGTGDFTIDCWVKLASLPSSGNAYSIVSQYEDSSNYWSVYYNNSSGTLQFEMFFRDGGVTMGKYIAVLTLDVERWYHVAFERTNSLTPRARIFVDGVSQTLTESTAFSTNDVGNMVAALEIGRTSTGTYFYGRIDELRISKGLARWTANFTPSTTAYTSDANTQLLMHLDNSNADSGNTGHSPTLNNVGFGGFGFNGTTQYVNVDSFLADITTDTKGTICFWFHTIGGGHILCLGDANGDTILRISHSSAGTADFYCKNAGTELWNANVAGFASINVWHHLVLTQNGVARKVYLDGVEVNISWTINTTPSAWLSSLSGLDTGRIGCRNYNSSGNDQFYGGMIDDFRYYKGLALGQAAIDLIYNGGSGMDSDIIIDSSLTPHKYIQTYGDAQYDAEIPTGYKSYAVFNGSSSYLSSADSADWDIHGTTTESWTLDFYARHSVTGTSEYYYSQRVDGNNTFNLFRQSDGALVTKMWDGGTNYDWFYSSRPYAALPLAGHWYHIAYIKSGSYYGMYVDGVQVGYLWGTHTVTYAAPLIIGQLNSTAYLNGGLDEFRIQKSNYFTASPNSFPAAPLITYSGGELTKCVGKFNGTSSYIGISDSDDWSFGTGAFTIDTWICGISTTVMPIYSQKTDNDNYINFYAYPTGIIFDQQKTASYTDGINISVAHMFSANTWYHIAVVRDGSNNWYIFVNGVSKTITLNNGTYSCSLGNWTGDPAIGRYYSSAFYLSGYMDEFRISKGIARWTSNFTPPTEPYAANGDTYTKFLIHFDGGSSFGDASMYSHSMTRNSVDKVLWNTGYGDVGVLSDNGVDGGAGGGIEFVHYLFNDNAATTNVIHNGNAGTLFDATASTNTSNLTTTGKINQAFAFNGTSQYVSLPGSLITTYLYDDTIGTICFWMYSAASGSQAPFCFADDSADNKLYAEYDGTAKNIYVHQHTGATTNFTVNTPNNSVLTSQWNHIVIVQDAVLLKVYVNGVLQTLTWTYNTKPGAWMADVTGVDIGRIGVKRVNGSDSIWFNGKIDDFRYYANQALSQFQINKIYNSGNGTETKIHAIYHNGSSDYATFTDTSGTDYDIVASSTDSWTIDVWGLPYASTSGAIASQYVDSNNEWKLYATQGSGINFFMRSSGTIYCNTALGGTVAANIWQHFALVKSGSRYACYIDGVQKNYVNDTSTATFTSSLYIGRNAGGGSETYWQGYLEQVQITHANKFGVVPAVLRIAFDGTDAATTYTAETRQTVTFAGTAQLDTAQKRFGVSSLLLDGNSDYVTVPDSDEFNFASGDFTIEFFVRFNSVGNEGFFSQDASASNNMEFLLEAGALYFIVDSGGSTISQVHVGWSPSTGQWYHMAIVRKFGEEIKIFINGALQTLSVDNAIGTTAMPDIAAVFGIGRITRNASYYTDGWIDDFKVYKGWAKYVAAFTAPTSPADITVPTALLTRNTITVPTAPYTPDANTKLLLHFNNDLTTDSSLTPHTVTNNATILGGPKWGTAALKFDGTTGYVTIPDSADWDIAANHASPYTVDMQVCHSSISGTNQAIINHSTNNSQNWRLFATSGDFRLYIEPGVEDPGWFSGNGVVTIGPGVWYHVAIVRIGAYYGVYYNGTQVIFGWQGTQYTTSNTLYVGGLMGASVPVFGNIDELRIQASNYFSAAPNSYPMAPLLIYGDSLKQSYAKFNGTTAYFTAPDSSDWDIFASNADNWTISFFVKVTPTGVQTFITQYESTSAYWDFYYDGDTATTGIGVQVKLNTVTSIDIRSGVRLTDSLWHHLAFVKVANVYGLYVDGVQIGYATTNDIDTFASLLEIGSINAGGYTDFLNGRMDELIISHSNIFSASPNVGKTNTLTPPTSRYTADANTVLLLHFDDSLTLDSSDRIASTDIDDEDMADISDWTDSDAGTGASTQVTFDSKSCMKLDSGGTAGGGNYAMRTQDVGAFGTRTTISLSLYCDAVGIRDDGDGATLIVYNGTRRAWISFASNGLFYYDGVSGVDYEIGTDLVVQDTWQEWTFDFNWSEATFDVYLNKALVAQGVPGMPTSAGTDGTISLRQNGTLTTNRISYIDWIRVGSYLGHTITNNNVTAETDNAGYGDQAVPSGTAGARRPTPVLLMNYDGYDEQTSYIAETGQTVTFQGDAEFDTTQKKYGSSSLILNDDSTYLKLLIHFNGADAATTHTAATGQTVTFAANAQLDTAQKKFGSASLLLDGTGDCATVPDSDDWNFAGDYTVEFWIRFNALPTTGDIVYVMSQYVDSTHWAGLFVQESGGSYYMGHRVRNGGDQGFASKDIPSLSTGVWYHMAYVRDYANSEIKYYLNGTAIGAAQFYPQSYGNFAAPLSIGKLGDAGANGINGWMDEFAVYSGVKKYTANFTAPTSRIGYKSYVTVPDSSDWNFAAGNFTIDCWVRFNSTIGLQMFYDQSVDINNRIHFYCNPESGSEQIYFYAISGGTLLAYYSAPFTPSINTWYHVAVSRNGTNLYLFVDGVSLTVTASTPISTNSLPDLAAVASIGRRTFDTSLYLNGWIDDLRITKGIALWTSNFTPQTSGATLLNTPNVTKFNTDTCLYFDGNSDYLTVTDTSGTDYDIVGLTSDSWTIDFWCKIDVSQDNMFVIQREDGSNQWLLWFDNDNGGTAKVIRFEVDSGGPAIISTITSANAINDNNWHHVSLIKNASNYGIYVDGIQLSFVDDGSTDTFVASLTVGGTSAGVYLNGYMEQVQITKANKFGVIPMPPPYAQYKLNDNTTTTAVVDTGTGANNGTAEVGVSLQCNFNGSTAAYTAETGQVATFTGNATLSTAQKVFGSGSLYLDGTASTWIEFPDSINWHFNCNFTVDFWVRMTALPIADNGYGIFSQVNGNDEQNALYFGANAGNTAHFMEWYTETGDVPNAVVFDNFSSMLSTNTWYHIAMTRDGNNYRLFLNGTQVGATKVNSVNPGNQPNPLRIGAWSAGSRFTGYLDDFRILRGAARWIENFTPPTSEATLDGTNYLSVTGKVNTAFRFARSEHDAGIYISDYVVLDNLIADIKTDTTGSISFWAKVHTDEGIIFSASDASDNYYFTIFPDGSGHVGVGFNHNTVNQWVAYTTATFTLDTWFHFAVVHNGTSPVLYFNGVDSTNITTSTDLTYWFNDASAYYDKCSMGVAYRFTSSGYVSPGNCSVDDFRYYQNTVLNATQVGYLYAAGVGTEDYYGEGDLVVPTALLTQNTITVPSAEYGQAAGRARSQSISVIL